MYKIFLSGGTSLVGSHIKQYFKDKHNVLSPTHAELELTDELAVREYILEHKPDTIIHAAHTGSYGKHTSDSLELNIRMEINLLRMTGHFKRIIYLSSGAVYGKERSLNMVSEDEIGEYIPQDQYGFAKLLASGDFSNHKGSTVLNLFGIYGEGEGLSRFPTYAMTQALKNLPIVIYRNAHFDYLYAGDLCRVIDHLLELKSTTPLNLNVSTGVPVDLVTIANKIVKLTKSVSDVVVIEEGLANAYTCDITRLKKILPKDFNFTTIDEGLVKLYQYFRMESMN